MSFTLYYAPGACSLSPHVALREAGLPFDLVKVDLRNKTLPDGSDYRAVSPKGYVPALRLPNGELLTENAVMIQYIADSAPEKELAPKLGTFERVRLAELLNFIATELHKGMSPLYNPSIGDAYRAALVDRLALRFAILDERLGKGPFLFGERFTVADGYGFYVMRAFQKTAKLPLHTERLKEYYARMSERPTVKAALEAEGLTP